MRLTQYAICNVCGYSCQSKTLLPRNVWLKRSAKPLPILAHQPQIGRLIVDMPIEYREWVIDFGDSGYIARYRLDGETIIILAICHQKEAGF